MNNLVTIDTFIQQVWNIEGVKIEIEVEEGTIGHLVRPYKYNRLPDDAEVEELKFRINECINKPFIWYVSGNRWH